MRFRTVQSHYETPKIAFLRSKFKETRNLLFHLASYSLNYYRDKYEMYLETSIQAFQGNLVSFMRFRTAQTHHETRKHGCSSSEFKETINLFSRFFTELLQGQI